MAHVMKQFLCLKPRISTRRVYDVQYDTCIDTCIEYDTMKHMHHRPHQQECLKNNGGFPRFY